MHNLAQPEKPAGEGESKPVHVRARCPKDLHRQLRMRAAEEGKPIEQVVLSLLRRGLETAAAA